MNWYKRAQDQSQPVMTKQMFEDILARAYGIFREEFKEDGILTWRQWLQQTSDDNISITVSSESSLYDLYLSKFPGAYFGDFVEAYRQNKLPNEQSNYGMPERMLAPPIPIEQTGFPKQQVPWAPQPRQQISDQQLQQAWQTIAVRRTKGNASQYAQASQVIFVAFNTDPNLAKRLGVKQGDLTKKLRSMGAYPVAAADMERRLNQGIPDEHSWVGISNISFLGQARLSHNDVAAFVKNIDVTAEGRGAWAHDGDALRRYMVAAFLAMDTRISYKDLSFKIGNCGPQHKNASGTYTWQDRLITLDSVSRNTVAHEIGHYLDHKWGVELNMPEGVVNMPHYLSDITSPLSGKLPQPYQQWGKKFRDFVQHLQKRSDIHSSYTQNNKEVFARFVSKFTEWTSNKSGMKIWESSDFRADNFTDADYQFFVRVLQEKSFLDAKYPIPK